ncbi:TetR/AcrR family transcriptional regulator [Acidimicrobiia bacterium EGI L10123]|uniref:TetR/AcrR family transcriptional regulator n=1 Tax=Salinilacustrithrix flava TaxID=2957203 RepID=UPI003D7C353F|nr:TetR/AcrR family transcriptional regulator [Acidimicrobiia bacterium EGI L10123]
MAGTPRISSTSSTGDRILAAALRSFGSTGIDGTSLDALARDLGVTKQAILYWYPSKEALLDAVIDFSAVELQRRFARAIETRPGETSTGFERVEAVVHAAFRLAARHPAMLGLMREVNRIGPPTSTRLTESVTPLLTAAAAWLGAEMDAGRLRRHDPKLLVLMAYSSVTGLATEVEVLRALGEEPTLASLVRRRDQLVDLLRDALVP